MRLAARHLRALDIPESLTGLREKTAAMLPRIDLPDLLLEVHAWTGFLDVLLNLDAGLTQLRTEGYPVREADVARLSPLGHAHLNELGRYRFPRSCPTTGCARCATPTPWTIRPDMRCTSRCRGVPGACQEAAAVGSSAGVQQPHVDVTGPSVP